MPAGGAVVKTPLPLLCGLILKKPLLHDTCLSILTHRPPTKHLFYMHLTNLLSLQSEKTEMGLRITRKVYSGRISLISWSGLFHVGMCMRKTSDRVSVAFAAVQLDEGENHDSKQ